MARLSISVALAVLSLFVGFDDAAGQCFYPEAQHELVGTDGCLKEAPQRCIEVCTGCGIDAAECATKTCDAADPVNKAAWARACTPDEKPVQEARQ